MVYPDRSVKPQTEEMGKVYQNIKFLDFDKQTSTVKIRLLTVLREFRAFLSRCVFGHVVAYVNDLTLPPAGQACVQEYPAFPAPEARRTPPPQWGPGSPAVHR